MKKIIALTATALFLFLSACGGNSQESAEMSTDEQDVEMVTDSIAIEMEQMNDDINESMNDLDSALNEIE